MSEGYAKKLAELDEAIADNHRDAVVDPEWLRNILQSLVVEREDRRVERAELTKMLGDVLRAEADISWDLYDKAAALHDKHCNPGEEIGV